MKIQYTKKSIAVVCVCVCDKLLKKTFSISLAITQS